MLAIQYMIGIYLKHKHDTIAGTSKCKTRGYKMTSDRLKIQNNNIQTQQTKDWLVTSLVYRMKSYKLSIRKLQTTSIQSDQLPAQHTKPQVIKYLQTGYKYSK